MAASTRSDVPYRTSLALFPFETPIYEKAGIPVTYVGHPLADILPMTPDRAATREMLGLRLAPPSSRCCPAAARELRLLADTFIETAKRVAEALPNARFLVPLATRETRLMFEEALYRCQAGHLPLTLLFGHAHDAMIAMTVSSWPVVLRRWKRLCSSGPWSLPTNWRRCRTS